MITNIPCVAGELEYILRLTSLWPGAYNIPACIFLCLPCITIMPFQIVRIFECQDDAIRLIQIICDFTTGINLYSKYFIVWGNRKYVKKIFYIL